MRNTKKQFGQTFRIWIARLRGGLIGFFVVAVLGTAVVLALTERAQAFSSDLVAANSQYPFIGGSKLDDCTLCHVSGSYARNPYGQAYQASGRNFVAIEGLDSDGDGFTNIVEIMALSFPGNAGDIPSQPTPTPTPFQPQTNTPTPTVTEPGPTVTPIVTEPGSSPTPIITEPGATITPIATEPGPTATPIATEPGPTATPTATEPAPTPAPEILSPFDIDIKNVKVTKHVQLGTPKPIEIRLDIENLSLIDGEGMASVIGVQNGVEVYNQSLTVSDPPGNGHSRYFFPNYTPAAAGEIAWTVTLSDDDPDGDEQVAMTEVSDVTPGGAGGVLDLDIKSFKVTKHVQLRKPKPIEIRLDVENLSLVDGEGMATVIGIQNGVEVYNQSLVISDPPGNGHSRYFFPNYTPSAAGEIIWTVTLSDDDPDDDTMVGSTLVDP